MKRGIGFYGAIASAAIGVIGLAAYMMNANTNYFKGLGIDSTIIGGMAVGIAALLVWAFSDRVETLWKDVLPIVAPATMIYALVMLVNGRVNGIAAIMTFDNNAKNQADLKSAFVAMAAMALAAILAAVVSFMETRKTGDEASQ